MRDSSLIHSTMADRALAEFRAPGTRSLAVVARRMGADVEHVRFGATVYTFDDDTSLSVTGRGRAHRVEVLLP